MLLNLDAGERDDEPEELWALADILAVACGGHAGDEASMNRLAAFAARSRYRTSFGAHPSYPDRAGFGRRTIEIAAPELERAVQQQCAVLAAAAHANGIDVFYVKPHGALYHDAAKNLLLANAIIDGAIAGLCGSAPDEDEDDGGLVGSAVDDGALGSHSAESRWEASRSQIAFIGPPTGCLADAVQIRGLKYLREGFADRAVREDGTLVPRGEPKALITDPEAAVERARQLFGQVDTICVHGDTPSAIEIARAVREVLGRAG